MGLARCQPLLNLLGDAPHTEEVDGTDSEGDEEVIENVGHVTLQSDEREKREDDNERGNSQRGLHGALSHAVVPFTGKTLSNSSVLTGPRHK